MSKVYSKLFEGVTTDASLQLPQSSSGAQWIYDPNQQLGPQQQQQQQQIFTTQQIQTIFQNYANITAEEKAELERLKQEYEQSIKIAKLSEFKKLPAELRQFMINIITWREVKEQIDSVKPDKSNRLKELEDKENNSKFFNGQYVTTSGSFYINSTIDFSAFLPLPEGITAEELKEAHTEATLEEEMLNEEERL